MKLRGRSKFPKSHIMYKKRGLVDMHNLDDSATLIFCCAAILSPVDENKNNPINYESQVIVIIYFHRSLFFEILIDIFFKIIRLLVLNYQFI